MKKTKSVLAGAITSILLLPGHALSASQAQTTAISFDIPSQPLVEALRAIASQTQQNVFFDPQIVAGHQAPALRAAMSAEEALVQALSGSGLTYRRIDERTVTIVPVVPAVHTTTSSSAIHQPRSAGWVKTSSLQSAIPADDARPVADEGSTQVSGSEPDTDAVDQQRSTIKLEEVVVTGSHIRGVQNMSAPVLSFDRKEIELGGFATTEQLIGSLPQSSNSISDTTLGNLNGGKPINHTYSGAGINLRGLGGDANLVLLNGRRLAATGNGSFVDLSLIPLGAIERVDVLTDGASAIYGSDAVGGVVNLILRQDFEGSETRVRYGAVTEGNHDELQVGQMLGHSWGSGQALVSYEYFRRTQLSGRDRDFFEPLTYEDVILIPEQDRHGALVVFNQRLSDRVQLSSELLFGQRDSAFQYQFPGAAIGTSSNVTQYGGSVGLNVDMARDWQLRLTGLLDKNDSEQRQVVALSGGESFGSFFRNENRMSSLDLAADGPLLALAGGDLRLAIGAHRRDEKFADEYIYNPVQLDRDVAAAYAELLVPLVGEGNARAGVEHLQLSVAGRYEDYSDFGSSFNPKIGLAWSPLQGLNVRGTWGTSFKAPLLTQQNANSQAANIMANYFAGTSPLGTGVILYGSGGNLDPEQSRNWTAGFDFSPSSAPALSLSASYFVIDYEDRISSPFASGYDPAGVLLDPSYAVLVTRAPDPEYVQAVLDSSPNVVCYDYQSGGEVCDSLPSLDEYVAVVDGRERNLAAVRLSGIDLSLGYRLPTAIGDFGVSLSGSQFLKYRQQLVPRAPEESAFNDVWRPVDLRIRGALSFSRNGFNVVTAVNYTDGYRDTRDPISFGNATPRAHVASWTTVDLTAQYDINRLWSAAWPELNVQLAIANLFDRDPPYVASSYGLFYDGVNADPRGRFVSAQFTARWGRR